MGALADIFAKAPVAIGMVHVRALPGTPNHKQPIDEIVSIACDEARTLQDAGFDGVLIENMHDAPYLMSDRIGPEIVASMTRVGSEVSRCVTVPMGVQVLAGANLQALAIAHAIGAAFVRVENFVFSHVADEGLMPRASAGELLRFRKAIGAQGIRVLADIKKKHCSHAITDDLSIGQCAQAAQFNGADGVIVTGAHTAEPASVAEVREASGACGLDVLVGSGATPQNVGDLLTVADGVIVGSALKQEGRWDGAMDPSRCRAFMEHVDSARN